MDDIKAELRRFIEDNFIMGAAGIRLADGDSLLERHVLDSTGFLELISHLEQAYSIKIADQEMVPENLDSLDNIAQFLARKRGTSSSS